MLSPDELKHLSKIAALVRAATPGLTFSIKEDEFVDEETGEWESHIYGQIKTGSGRIMSSVGKDFLQDGELFASARDELAWLLRLVKRLSEGSGVNYPHNVNNSKGFPR